MFLNKSNLSLFCLKWKHMKVKVLLAVTNKCNNTCTWDWWVWSEKSKLLKNKICYLYSTYSLRCNIRFRRCYLIWGHLHLQINTFNFREDINIKKSQNCRLFPYGGGAQPHSIVFGGVFPNITEAILVVEISTKVRIYPPKVIT